MKSQIQTFTPSNCSMCEFFSFSSHIPTYTKDHCHRYEIDMYYHLRPCPWRLSTDRKTATLELKKAERRFASELIHRRQKKIRKTQPPVPGMRHTTQEDRFVGFVILQGLFLFSQVL